MDDVKDLQSKSLIGFYDIMKEPSKCYIDELPAELLEGIAKFLSHSALLNFRLTSKEMEAKTFHYFANSKFTTKWVLPTKDALETLVEISKSRYAPYVKKVVLGPATKNHGEVHFGSSVETARKNQIFQGMKQYAYENSYMRRVGLDTCLLVSAFSGFPKCISLELDHEHFCFHPHEMGTNGCRLGSKKALLVSGNGIAHFCGDAINHSTSLSRLLTLSLHAAMVSRLDLQEFVAYGTDRSMRDIGMIGYSIMPLELPPMGPESGFAFSNLRVLKLPLAQDEQLDDDRELQDLVMRLKTFISTLPKLEVLGLQFTTNVLALSFLLELTETPLSTSMPSVKELEIINMNICEENLIELLERLRPTIERLTLSDMDMDEAKTSYSAFIYVLQCIKSNMRLTLLDIDGPGAFIKPIRIQGPGFADRLQVVIKDLERQEEKRVSYSDTEEYDHVSEGSGDDTQAEYDMDVEEEEEEEEDDAQGDDAQDEDAHNDDTEDDDMHDDHAENDDAQLSEPEDCGPDIWDY